MDLSVKVRLCICSEQKLTLLVDLSMDRGAPAAVPLLNYVIFIGLLYIIYYGGTSLAGYRENSSSSVASILSSRSICGNCLGDCFVYGG